MLFFACVQVFLWNRQKEMESLDEKMNTFVMLILSNEHLSRLSLFNFPSEIYEGDLQPHKGFYQVMPLRIYLCPFCGQYWERRARGWAWLPSSPSGTANFPTATGEAV